MLEASAPFFNTYDHHSTSLKDVAQSIGITKLLFYHYFKDSSDVGQPHAMARAATKALEAEALQVLA